MKKRIRKTGEIVDVISWNNLLGKERSSLDSVSYIDSKGNECVRVKGLNLAWDFEDVEEVLSTDIDWETRRYEIAKDILAATYDYPMDGKPYAKIAVGIADALIAELKKGGNNEKH